MAAMAALELEATLEGGAGLEILEAVRSWSRQNAQSNDFAVANLGQLKAVASLFHQRLQREGYVWGPWKFPFIPGPSNDFAPANLGQLKALFAFDLSADLDGDGLPDWWEFRKLSVFEGSSFRGPDYEQTVALFDGDSDPDGDGLSNAQERSAGSDPADFYNGQAPHLQVLAGDGQFEPTRGSEGVPLAILVSDSAGQPLANAPVRFWVSEGDIVLAGDAAWSDWLPEVRSDAQGRVIVPVRLGAVGGSVQVSAVRAPGRERANPERSEQLLLRYFGRPQRERLGDGATAGANSMFELGVRYGDSGGRNPLAGQWVQVRCKSGDARVALEGQEGEVSLETDAQGWVRFPVRKGRLWSELEVDLGGWTERFQISPEQEGVLEVVGSSVQGHETAFPADGVPVVWLNSPVPDWATDEQGRLRGRVPGGVAGLWMWVEVPVSRASDGSVRVQVEQQAVPGEWLVLPGRCAVAFIPEKPLWQYRTWAPPNPVGVERWWQKNLRFQIGWDGQRLPFELKEPFQADFVLCDSDAFIHKTSGLGDGPERLRMELERGVDSFVLEPALAVEWMLPERESEGVDARLPMLWIQFNQALSGAWLEESRVGLLCGQETIPCSVQFEYRTLRLRIVPQGPLEWGKSYEITGLEGMRSLSGASLEGVIRYGFRTASGPGQNAGSVKWNPAERVSSDPKIIRPDASFIVTGEGDSWDWGSVEATWVCEQDPTVEIGARVGVNAVTRRVVVSAEERLESGVVYRLSLKVRRKATAGAPLANELDGGMDTAVFRLRAEDPRLRESLGAASSDYGSGPGAVPAAVGVSPSATAQEVLPEGSFRFPYLINAVLSHPNDGSPTSVELVYRDLKGGEIQEVVNAPIQDTVQAGVRGKIGVPVEGVSPALTLGTVIRMRAVANGGGGSGYAPAVAFARVPEKSPLRSACKAPLVNFHYLCFEKYQVAERNFFQIGFIDGLDPGYPKNGIWSVLHRVGSAPVGGMSQEMRWCPVIVRDELDSPERTEEEFVLSTRRGDHRVAPMQSSGGMFELLESYKARLKKFYGLPYPSRSIAWISVYGDDSPGSDRANFWDPAMPHLTASIREAPEEVMGCWRLRVFYDRANGRGMRSASDPRRIHPRTQPEDFVDIPGRPMPEVFPYDAPLRDSMVPKSGSAREALWRGNVPGYTDWMPASAEWRIFETPEWQEEIRKRGFFGGEAILYWVPKPESAGSNRLEAGQSGAEMEVARFRIGGKNPSNGVARFWMEGRNAQGEENVPGVGRTDDGSVGPMWYAYAIAKHETAEYRYVPPGGSQEAAGLYNQFRAHPGRADCGFPAWNNDGDGKPGGYGIFQVTGNVVDEDSNIPRRQIWNWQDNMRAGGVMLRSKWKGALASLQASKQVAQGREIPALNVRGVFFREDTEHTILDAMTMKRFNGASKPNPVDKIDWGDNRSGYVQGFAVSEAERGDYCYRSDKRGLWCLCRFNGLVKIIENPDKSKTRIYLGFDYVDRVCAEIEPGHRDLGGVAGR